VKGWQTALAILAALFASLAFAEDFKTINGKEYKNATVSRVEADGLVLKTKSGILKVYFVELPKEVQEHFGYRPPIAAPVSVSSATVVPHPAASGVLGKWEYSEYQDTMGRGTTREARVTSSNAVHFRFPYEGETHAALKLRKGSKGQNVIFRVERGQFISSASKDYVTVSFDNGELQEFEVIESEARTSGVLFINDEERFISQLRNANTVKIEATFYQEGRRVFEFDVRGLDW
jgi:hypothetical protein